MLGLSRSVVSGLIAAGFVKPVRGARREYRFSFQDLVVLRAAHALTRADISPSRILRALRTLRAKLPLDVPLAGLSVRAVGNAVVVREGAAEWRTEDGQYVLQFDVTNRGGNLAFLAPPVAQPPEEDWFERALSLEQDQPAKACDAYRRAIDADPGHREAYINLGCLLHERGALHEARTTYREGLSACGPDPMLIFNLAVLEEDLGALDVAKRRYLEALALRPDLADAHFNLARLYEGSGAHKEALRHWSAYRKLAPTQQ